MKPINYAATGLTLAVALTALPACGTNTALVGRDTLPAHSASQPARSEVVGTVWNGSIPDPARFIFDRVLVIREW